MDDYFDYIVLLNDSDYYNRYIINVGEVVEYGDIMIDKSITITNRDIIFDKCDSAIVNSIFISMDQNNDVFCKITILLDKKDIKELIFR